MKKVLLFSFCALLAGMFIGFILPHTPITKTLQNFSGSSETHLGGYTYISPLLDCEQNQNEGEIEYKPSQVFLQNYFTQLENQHVISDIGFYYRDLNNGPWFSINEKDPFSPASLLKIPVMMAYYRQAETDPTILQKKILFTKSLGITEQFFQPKKTLTPNTSYTVDELVSRMIVYSDNDATWLLENNIDNSLIDKVTLDLGIATATDSTPDDYMSVRDYATLYRVLYNASYLDRNYSEKALGLLAQTDFPAGIGASLPDSLVVADKFGERTLDNGIKQLHDCGIIYYPHHPYLLCIMTRGWDFTQLSKVIEKISLNIYTDIKTKYH